MLTVRANREEINLIAPKVLKTFSKGSCFEVWLNIPNRLQRDSSSSAHPVMGNFAAGRRQCSANSHLEGLTIFLKRPRIHHPPASNKPDAVVLPQVLGSSRNSMAFQIRRRGTDNAPRRQNLLCDHTVIGWQADAQGEVKPIIDHIQA